MKDRIVLKLLLLSSVILTLHGTIAVAQDETWIRHASFKDFSRGQPGNSGQNLFVSHRGRVQVINRWDLNRDGYPDLLFTSSHNIIQNPEALVYWGSSRGFDSLLPPLMHLRPRIDWMRHVADPSRRISHLPAFGGGRSVVADLDNDGFPEVIFVNYIHNYPGIRMAYIYGGGADGYQADRRTELPTLWAAGVAAGDLNQDGWPDLVFANEGLENARNLKDGQDDQYASYIYWGGPEGYSAGRRDLLPTRGARDVVIEDWNDDGWLDVALLNESELEQSVVIYWGGSSGFDQANKHRIPVEGGTSLTAADVNADGSPDLIVTASGKESYVFWGDKRQVNSEDKLVLATQNAVDSYAGDLNGDGFLDLAFANKGGSASYIYFGAAGGLSSSRRLELPTLAARGVTADDLNADGFVDLIFANSEDPSGTRDAPSYIYWGSEQGFAPYLRSDLAGFGTVSVQTGDFDKDGHADVLLVNQTSGRTAQASDSLIYWGNSHYVYSTASMTTLPSVNAYGSTTADLNDDGWVDVVICNNASADIYWGGSDGYSVDRRDVLPVVGAINSSAADFNQDGYLDLLFSHAGPDGGAAASIWWGGPTGFDDARRTELTLRLRTSNVHVVADFNRDGYLDIVFPDASANQSQIYWGSPEGFQNSLMLETPASGAETADLNQDGWLDLVFSGRKIPETGSHNTRTAIYWGGPEGYSPLRSQTVESFHVPEMAIADLNRDGYLDLVLVSYLSDHTRSLPVFIYWGNEQHQYSETNRSALPAESPSGLQILDLNEDGYLDVVVHNHIKDGNHNIESYLYWGGPDGFSVNRRSHVLTIGPHHSQFVDPGNVYTRKFEEEYLSAPIEAPAGKKFAALDWKAEIPRAAGLVLQVRSAESREALAAARWTGPAGADTFFETPKAALNVSHGHRWLQYRVLFTSVNGASYPILTEVGVGCR